MINVYLLNYLLKYSQPSNIALVTAKAVSGTDELALRVMKFKLSIPALKTNGTHTFSSLEAARSPKDILTRFRI